MGRYRRLGLMKKSSLSRRESRKLSRVERFISDSQVRDIILYNRLSRARPRIRHLEYADDVDWKMEYYFELCGSCLLKMLNWILQPLSFITRFLQQKLEASLDAYWNKKYYRSNDDDGSDFSQKATKSDFTNTRIAHSINKDAVTRVWRFRNCRPFLNRRVFKRKWLHKSEETREWSEQTLQQARSKVHQDFRSMCSGVGKDTKIYVVSVASPTECPSSSVVTTSVFLADSQVLTSKSALFKLWFRQNRGIKNVQTSFVTPEEMEAILVYLYTETWPLSMIVTGNRNEHRRISRRFFEILDIYGIPLTVKKKSPYINHQDNVMQLYIDSSSSSLEDNLHLDCFFPFNEYGQGDFFQIVNDRDDYKAVVSKTKSDSLAVPSSSLDADKIKKPLESAS